MLKVDRRKNSRTTDVNFLHADFSVPKLDTNKHEKIDINPNEVMAALCGTV
jgi:hypothetical protein